MMFQLIKKGENADKEEDDDEDEVDLKMKKKDSNPNQFTGSKINIFLFFSYILMKKLKY